MSVLFIALPLALLLAAAAVWAFARAMRSGQFDDLETPALRILFDDVEGTPEESARRRAPPTRGAPSDPR